MKSAVKTLIDTIHSLLDNTLSPVHPDGTSVTLRAYTSTPTNADTKYLRIRLVSEEDVSPKDRHMSEGIIAVDMVERTKSDDASALYIHRVREAVEGALAPTLNYLPSSSTDGSTIDFGKSSVTFNEEYSPGDGKVFTITLELNYRLEWN